MGKIDEQLRNVPPPQYKRDQEKLVKQLDKSYREMLTYVVTQLSKGVQEQSLIREIEIMKQVNIWIGQIDTDMAKGLDSLIKKTFNEGQAYHLLAVGEADTWEDALSNASFNRVQRAKMEALMADTYRDILMATQNTAVAIKRVVRSTVAQVAQYHSLRNNHYDEQAKDLYSQLTKKGLSENIQKQGFVGITDRAGRKWDLKVYSNMVIKTKTNQAFTEGIIHEAEESGIDLAIISDHGAEDACSKWEGVIISMTGATAGYPTYKEVRATNQIFHPNCEHSFHPIRNLDVVHPEDLTKAKAKAKALKLEPPKKATTNTPPKVEVDQSVLTHENIKLPRQTDTVIFDKLGANNYDNLHNIVNNAPAKHKAVWGKMESSLTVVSATEKRHPVCWGVRGIEMDVTADAKGDNWSKPYQTTFHEFGHNIDYIANVKYGDGNKYLPISHTYKNGLLANTIKEEITDLITALDKKMKQEFKEKSSDIEWLRDNGYIEAYEYSFYQKHGKLYTTPKYAKKYAYKAFEKELRAIPSMARANLSDIVEGATGAKVRAGFGHGATYWKDRPHGLATEAFAEMFDSGVANTEQLEAIKKYMPKAYLVFEEILDHIKNS